MNISDVYSAMRLKIRLNPGDSSVKFKSGSLLRIWPSNDDPLIFLVRQYGKGAGDRNVVLCRVSRQNSEYLLDLIKGENDNVFRCLFVIDEVEDDHISVQTYVFQSVTEYKTAISIVVPDDLYEEMPPEKLYHAFVWEQLDTPALFCLNYKSSKKQRENIRFIGNKSCLIARNTSGGIYAEKITYYRDRYDLPVDLYIAPKIRFVSQSDTTGAGNSYANDMEKFSSSSSYFGRWEAYDTLSRKLLEAESTEFGEFPYSAYTHRLEKTGVIYEFTVEEAPDGEIIGTELAASEPETVEEQLSRHSRCKRQFDVGHIQEISNNKITTILINGGDTNEVPPKEGVLKLYTAGDQYIMARRKSARDRMLNHQAPIKSIVALIESGISGYELPSVWGSEPPITSTFRRNFKRADDLNSQQIKALELAINTPDIALIQGPPGTGKTTVIKAICERFREIFESREKMYQKRDEEHILRSPKILISSFQNEAVDNAISAPLSNDLPAYRKTAKRANDNSSEQYQRALGKWYTGLRESLSEMIIDSAAPEYLGKKRALDDAYLSYKNAGEPIEQAAALIEQYLNYTDVSYPMDLVADAKAIISAAFLTDTDDEDPFVKKLESQRLSPESFEDDGNRNARRLAAYIRVNDDLGVSAETLKAIEAVTEENYSEEAFASYVSAVTILQKRYCRERRYIDPQDRGTINECLLRLANTFSQHYLNTLSSLESKKSLILSDFLNRLEQEYETVVKDYSMTTAATCQTSLDLHDDRNKTYDLVIVDEAARANPLDLFIPMSMGKKIILVGDHKQLPHMLEPDVVKLLKDDPRYSDIPEIEKSLLERLFEMFSKGTKPKAIQLTTQFRMHPEICQFVSDMFYDGILQTDKSISPEQRSSPKEINNGKPLTFKNIPYSHGGETSGKSKSRGAEVKAIEKDVRNILSADPGATIGIITFYSAQAQLIKRRMEEILNDEERSFIEVGSVDAFQGKEFDYVLLSCVRSNFPGKDKAPVVGFLNKPNRLCVAFSRAIRQLVVYGDADTLNQIPCFKKLSDLYSQ